MNKVISTIAFAVISLTASAKVDFQQILLQSQHWTDERVDSVLTVKVTDLFDGDRRQVCEMFDEIN